MNVEVLRLLPEFYMAYLMIPVVSLNSPQSHCNQHSCCHFLCGWHKLVLLRLVVQGLLSLGFSMRVGIGVIEVRTPRPYRCE